MNIKRTLTLTLALTVSLSLLSISPARSQDPADAVAAKYRPRIKMALERYEKDMEIIRDSMSREYNVLLQQSLRRGDLEKANFYQAKIKAMREPATPDLAAEPATPADTPTKLGFASFKTRGDHGIRKMRDGETVWHNKDYRFHDLPDEFDNLRYVYGSSQNEVEAECLKEGDAYLFIPGGQHETYREMVEKLRARPTKHQDWPGVRNEKMNYPPSGYDIMKIRVKKGDRIAMPSSLLLLAY